MAQTGFRRIIRRKDPAPPKSLEQQIFDKQREIDMMHIDMINAELVHNEQMSEIERLTSPQHQQTPEDRALAMMRDPDDSRILEEPQPDRGPMELGGAEATFGDPHMDSYFDLTLSDDDLAFADDHVDEVIDLADIMLSADDLNFANEPIGMEL